MFKSEGEKWRHEASPLLAKIFILLALLSSFDDVIRIGCYLLVQGLQIVATMTSLKKVTLMDSVKVNSKGIKLLQSFTSLEELALLFCAKILTEDLSFLQHTQKLHTITLFKCEKVSSVKYKFADSCARTLQYWTELLFLWKRYLQLYI